jgi:hypothetical protein
MPGQPGSATAERDEQKGQSETSGLQRERGTLHLLSVGVKAKDSSGGDEIGL